MLGRYGSFSDDRPAPRKKRGRPSHVTKLAEQSCAAAVSPLKAAAAVVPFSRAPCEAAERRARLLEVIGQCVGLPTVGRVIVGHKSVRGMNKLSDGRNASSSATTCGMSPRTCSAWRRWFFEPRQSFATYLLPWGASSDKIHGAAERWVTACSDVFNKRGRHRNYV